MVHCQNVSDGAGLHLPDFALTKVAFFSGLAVIKLRLNFTQLCSFQQEPAGLWSGPLFYACFSENSSKTGFALALPHKPLARVLALLSGKRPLNAQAFLRLAADQMR
ncbi:hypothetical protein TH63_15505 [Rufibacter radiotolerans]|uniref:Uncharacterized protein n=1 Tax=Rufibacter radiotolerans TaxID=1379910 RepID=A0A0H4VN16_9BACT|nr:hypothetical protein TH63_15505 [Rufibacter radiotolerans]